MLPPMAVAGSRTTIEHVRVLRAVAVCVLAAGLGGAGHVLAGGAASSTALAAALLVTLPIAWRVAGRECSVAAIAGLLALGQLVVHGAAVGGALLTAPPAQAATSFDPSALVCGLSHHAAAGGGGEHRPLAMLAAHVLATAVAALWLRRGERAVWRALRATGRLVARLVAAPARRPAAAPLPLAVVQVAIATPRRSALAAGWSRRGPPRLASA